MQHVKDNKTFMHITDKYMKLRVWLQQRTASVTLLRLLRDRNASKALCCAADCMDLSWSSSGERCTHRPSRVTAVAYAQYKGG